MVDEDGSRRWPLRAADPGNAVMLSQGFVEKGIVGLEQVQDRPVVLKEIGQEPNRFFIHRLAQSSKAGEGPGALAAALVEIVDAQPLAAKLDRQVPHP